MLRNSPRHLEPDQGGSVAELVKLRENTSKPEAERKRLVLAEAQGLSHNEALDDAKLLTATCAAIVAGGKVAESPVWLGEEIMLKQREHPRGKDKVLTKTEPETKWTIYAEVTDRH